MMPTNFYDEDESDDSCVSGSVSEDELLQQTDSSDCEPDLECDEWDKDCKVLLKSPSSLIGKHYLSQNSESSEYVAKKIKAAPALNTEFSESAFVEECRTCWNKGTGLVKGNAELIVEPFKVCILNNFLENDWFLDELKQEFNDLDWNCRNMDLYEFFQSKDLKYLNQEKLTSMLEYLKTDVMKLVSNLTGYELTNISATCSIYTNTDYLLVHDDQREDRRVAFILYLTGKNGWNERKGGALQLLNKDEFNQPYEVVRNIFPANNQLVLFAVSNDSYHQVAEVTTLDDCRLSINGWFHSKTPPTFETPVYRPLENGLFGNNLHRMKEVDIDLESWINDCYLEPHTISAIQNEMEENSETALCNFLKPESFLEISQTLADKDIKWIRVGPPNRYCYEIIDMTSLPHSLRRFLDLFQSRELFSLLFKYTELEFLNPNASMKFELQRWTPGSYSLLTDYDWKEKNELDLIMFFGCVASNDVVGARTQYVTIEDEIQYALITLNPTENILNMVYRDSARFTKYFSKLSRCKCLYALICSYSE